MLNDRLAELGYPTKEIERLTERGLAFRERKMTPLANLASTAALEHFTATLAEVILSSERARDAMGAQRRHGGAERAPGTRRDREGPGRWAAARRTNTGR